MNLCECGCGQEVSKEGNRFLHGHSSRIRGRIKPESYQKVRDSWKVKMANGYTSPNKGHSNLAIIGHIVTEETREKIREKIQDLYDSGKLVNGFLGKHPSEEVRLLKCGDRNSSKRPEVRAKIKLARSKQVIPVRDTSIEVKMQTGLSRLRIPFQTHKPILGQPDIFIEPNICIFCDGDYWHNREDNKRRDAYVDRHLTLDGYVVLRLWEHEINTELDLCLKKVLDLLDSCHLIRGDLETEVRLIKMRARIAV